MSDVMLCGILRMPFDHGNDLHLMQLQQACREAANELEHREDEIARLREALDAAYDGLNDWTATYAKEFCSDEMVATAQRRISVGGGTLAYIAGIVEKIRPRPRRAGDEGMTDTAIEAAAKTLFENTPIGNRSWQWCCDKLPALAEKWRVCARAAIVAYEKVRWDEAMGRYREVLDRQRDRPLPPPPGKEG